MKEGFSGSQKGMTHAQRVAFADFLLLSGGEFHHGMCKGADDEASRIAMNLGYHVIGHPGTNGSGWGETYGVRHQQHSPRPYLKRNHDIVDACEHLSAAPSGPEKQRSGTWATIRYARKQGKPVTIFYPDGSVEA